MLTTIYIYIYYLMLILLYTNVFFFPSKNQLSHTDGGSNRIPVISSCWVVATRRTDTWTTSCCTCPFVCRRARALRPGTVRRWFVFRIGWGISTPLGLQTNTEIVTIITSHWLLWNDFRNRVSRNRTIAGAKPLANHRSNNEPYIKIVIICFLLVFYRRSVRSKTVYLISVVGNVSRLKYFSHECCNII